MSATILLARARALELLGTGSHAASVAPGFGGSFAFAAHQSARAGDPVAYDPCQPVQVRVNRDLAPLGTRGVVEEAVDAVAAATGLHMVVVDDSHDLPTETGGHASSPSAAHGPQPVLVAWTTEDQVPRLRGRVVGLGGSVASWDPPTGRRRYVTGTVSLDTPSLSLMLRQPHGRALVRAVVMHELGHVVGLAHVHDPAELMNADNDGLTSFGPGDRRGLQALGQGHCFG